jgi:glycerophosphoryl diester phosphodiesterase
MAASSHSPKRVRNYRLEALIWPPLKIAPMEIAREAPQNPLAAFELALREGAEGIALNVQLSSDGVPVVICDAPLGRTTSSSGGVEERPASTLLQLDTGSRVNRRFPSRTGRQYTRAHISLLSEVLQWVREQKCLAYVTVNHPTPRAEVEIIKAIDRARVRHLTRVIACDLAGLRRIRQLDAKVHLGLRFVGRPPAIHHVKALEAEVLLPHWTAGSPSFIRRAHRASLLVIPWTVNSPRQMRRTILEGVDGIITNYPAKLAEAVVRLQKTLHAVAP